MIEQGGLMPKLKVSYHSGKAFKVIVRGHEFISDQPLSNEGQDLGPTPVEFFMGSMGSCTGLFASLYLKRNDLDVSKLLVYVSWEYEKNPSRVGKIVINVETGLELSKEHLLRLRKTVEGCTIHKTLLITPEIEISLS